MQVLFGTKHLILIGICAAFIVGGYFLTRKWDMNKLIRTLFHIGVASELIKVFY